MQDLLAQIDAQRERLGFMTVRELLDVHGSGNFIPDPFSVLVSHGVTIGSANILYPNVILETQHGGVISIGSENILYPGTLLLADQGVITIGDDNLLGDGGVRIKATLSTAAITIRSHGRYMNGANILGTCNLESGTQVLGPITVENCTLRAGGSFREPDPDLRGGVLKGSGVARALEVRQGEVINGIGVFETTKIERQTAYHAKPSSGSEVT